MTSKRRTRCKRRRASVEGKERAREPRLNPASRRRWERLRSARRRWRRQRARGLRKPWRRPRARWLKLAARQLQGKAPCSASSSTSRPSRHKPPNHRACSRPWRQRMRASRRARWTRRSPRAPLASKAPCSPPSTRLSTKYGSCASSTKSWRECKPQAGKPSLERTPSMRI